MGDQDWQNDGEVDEALEETFPATDNPAARRFELTADGATAFLQYERTRDVLKLIHTEVPEHLRGRRVGDALVKAALDAGRSEGLRIVAVCPFVRAYLRKHALSP